MVKGYTDLIVLALLRRLGPVHGYALRAEMRDLSHQIFHMSFGSLYPLLHDLEKRRLLTSRIHPAGEVRTQRRFSITKAGEDYLQHQIQKWEMFSQALESVIRKRGNRKQLAQAQIRKLL
ncbi:MAG: PadR family transcriptional regulator [Kiritimatiellae bacterium]|nr:PadR family transcriptional regulator [Kiritimatiellia bacterium]